MIKETEQIGFMAAEQRQQFTIMDVPSRDQQQLSWTFPEFETQLKIGVLSSPERARRDRVFDSSSRALACGLPHSRAFVARACPKRVGDRDLIAHFIAHLIEK